MGFFLGVERGVESNFELDINRSYLDFGLFAGWTQVILKLIAFIVKILYFLQLFWDFLKLIPIFTGFRVIWWTVDHIGEKSNSFTWCHLAVYIFFRYLDDSLMNQGVGFVRVEKIVIIWLLHKPINQWVIEDIFSY